MVLRSTIVGRGVPQSVHQIQSGQPSRAPICWPSDSPFSLGCGPLSESLSGLLSGLLSNLLSEKAIKRPISGLLSNLISEKAIKRPIHPLACICSAECSAF